VRRPALAGAKVSVSRMGGPEATLFGESIVARARELYAGKVARGEVPAGFASAPPVGAANG
jgi:hypothetical protein